jgi:hypothetical protein
MNYIVVLFKDKKKKKIINKFKTEKKAIDFYKKLIGESDNVIFEKRTENGLECTYELGLLRKKTNNQQPLYIKDDLGRQIKVELEDDEYEINKIKSYNLDETFVDYSTKQKISTQQFIKKYLKKPGIKMLSKLNNKIVLQNQDYINLFTFKSIDDSNRFIDCLQEKLDKEIKNGCIFVKDYTTVHRKYLYNILIEYGYPINYLQRHLTAHPSKK